MKHNYLIAYDIRQAKRLRRVHYFISKRATALQRSVFLITDNTAAINDISQGVLSLAKTEVDDIRLYPIQELDKIWVAGMQSEKFHGLYGSAKIGAKKNLAKQLVNSLLRRKKS